MRRQLAVSFSLLAAAGPQLAAADSGTAVVDRYAKEWELCWNRRDAECVQRLFRTDTGESVESKFDRDACSYAYDRMEVAPAWDLIEDDNKLLSAVPYTRTMYSAGRRSWMERTGFLLGISDDGGVSWRFVDSPRASNYDFNKLAVEHYGGSPPAERWQADELPPTRSRYLETTSYQFIPGDEPDSARYQIDLQVRRKIKTDIPAVAMFFDPFRPNEPLASSLLLETGQQELSVTSPVLFGFKRGDAYSVVVLGWDMESGREIFRHEQHVLYFPVPELPAPAVAPREVCGRPVRVGGYELPLGNRLYDRPLL